MNPSPLRIAVLSATAVAIVGCTDNTGPADHAPAVTEISISPQNATMSGGGTKQLTVTVTGAKGSIVDPTTVIWVTSNAQVATVSPTGLVTASPVDASVDITATSGGKTATVTIAVKTFMRMSAGFGFTCALDTQGAAYCWGRNDHGQLGNGTASDKTSPTKVSTNVRFAAISSARAHTCAIAIDGLAYCWGSNTLDESAGINIGTDQLTPVSVGGGVGFVSIAAGINSTCGTTADHDVYCWGYLAYTDFFGDALAGVKTTQATKIGSGMVAVVAGIDGQYCSVDPSSLAYCWSLLYTYPMAGPIIPPIHGPVSTSIHFSTLRLGLGHVCGLDTNGKAYCWGNNYYGEVGDGTTDYRSVPTPVAGGVVFQSLAAGGHDLELESGPFIASYGGYTCGLTSTGKAYCWGYNGDGELGLGAKSSSVLTPQEVAGGVMFTGLRAGATHTCGLATTGAAYCWGDNGSGQLGDGTNTSTPQVNPVFGK